MNTQKSMVSAPGILTPTRTAQRAIAAQKTETTRSISQFLLLAMTPRRAGRAVNSPLPPVAPWAVSTQRSQGAGAGTCVFH